MNRRADPLARSLQDGADRVNLHLAKAAASVIAAGQVLIELKRTTPHGDWARLFIGHPQAIARPIRLSVGTAERFMQIARHPVLSKSAHAPNLPSAWTTLYELSKLDEETVTRALTEGRITPELDRLSVAALAPAEPITRPEDDPAQVWATRINESLARQAQLQRTVARQLLQLPDNFRLPYEDQTADDRSIRRARRRVASILLLEAEEVSPDGHDAE
jgi:hypothetical protein